MRHSTRYVGAKYGTCRQVDLGLIHTASRAEPSRADSAWKTNLRYEMGAFTLHAEPSRTEPDRA